MHELRKFSILIIFLTLCLFSHSEKYIDSLYYKLLTSNDSLKSEIYKDLAFFYIDSSGNKAIKYAEKTIEYAEKNNQKEELIYGYFLLGSAYLNKNNFKLALKYLFIAENLCSDINNNFLNYSIHTNIGITYKYLNQYDLAIDNYNKALDYSLELNNNEIIIQTYMNLGNIYLSDNKIDTGLIYYNKAIEENKKTDEYFDYLPILHNNLGHIYQLKRDYTKALWSYETAYYYFDSTKNLFGMSVVLNNIAEIKIINEDYYNAEILINKSDSLHNLNEYFDARKNLYETTFQLFNEVKDYERAIKYLKKYYELKDSIYTEELDLIISDLKVKHETDKLKIETENKDIEIEKQQKYNLILLIILLVISILLISLIFTIIQKSKLNKTLKILNVKLQVAQDEITDNLKYARKIQRVLMNSSISTIPYKYFIIDLPKDIVGGDFYLMKQIQNKYFIILADSTGHGVSGGFLSVLGIEFLNAALNKYNNISDILNYLNTNFYNYFTKSNNLGNESLCVSIICIENHIVYFGGSKHKIWHYNSNMKTLNEYKTDNYIIGNKNNINFSSKEIDIEENDLIFLSSDGYPDQFGGKNNEKLKYNRFRKILTDSSAAANINESKEFILNEFLNWKSENEQTDDILLIGIKFKK